jgi:hypothetical protein
VKLKKISAYSIINDLNINEATEADADELYKSWDIHGASKAEKEAFLKAFIDKSQINDDTSIGHRTATIELLTLVLKNNKNKMNIHDLRVNMAYGFNSEGKFIDFNQSLKNAQYRWLVLQIRQAQRFALEGLFSWIEYMILENHLSDMDSISNMAFKVLNSSPVFKNKKDILSIYNSMFNNYNSIYSMIDDIETKDGLCIFDLMNDIQDSLNDYSDELIVYSMQTILLCSYYYDLLKKEKNVCDLLSQGDSRRISLKYLNETLKRCGEMKLQDFIIHIFENFILSQHFAVAAGRYDGTTQRLRISIEEDGLRCLNDEPWRPSITSDSLHAVLSLLHDCDIIRVDWDDNIVELL